MNLRDIKEGVRRCIACPRFAHRFLPIIPEGDNTASCMIVFAYPYVEEDRTGTILVPPLISSTLKELHYTAYITSLVKCYDTHKPLSSEILTCFELWFLQEIRLINPECIILIEREEKVIPLQIIERITRAHTKVFIIKEEAMDKKTLQRLFIDENINI